MIADELNKLKETKAAIKQALIDKGQNPTDEFSSYASNINSISASKGNLLALRYNRTQSTSNSVEYTINGEYIQAQTRNIFIPQPENTDVNLQFQSNYSAINEIYINFKGLYNYNLDFNQMYSSQGVTVHFGRGLDEIIANGYSLTINFPWMDKCICHEEDYNLRNWLEINGCYPETNTEPYVYKEGVYLVGEIVYDENSFTISNEKGDHWISVTTDTYVQDVSYYQPITALRPSREIKEVLSFPDTSNITTMDNMFSYVSMSNFDFLKTFNTSKVTTMESMFYQCQIEDIDLSSFDTSNVTIMDSMFYGISVSSGTLVDLSGWDTSKVTTMYGMFRGASSNSDVLFPECFGKNCTNMNYMFYSSSLPAIYNIDWSSLTSVTNF
jgi:surface protein